MTLSKPGRCGLRFRPVVNLLLCYPKDQFRTTPWLKLLPQYSPRFAVASWHGDRLTVWKASHNVHGDRDKLARIFELPHDQVRVVDAYLGGGFGSKDETRLGHLTALLARKAGRPVRMGYSRKEELGYGKWRAATTTTLRTGIKRNGTFTTIDTESALNTGPYAPGYGVASGLGHGVTYLYRCANARFIGKFAFTNAPVAGSYRRLDSFKIPNLINTPPIEIILAEEPDPIGP